MKPRSALLIALVAALAVPAVARADTERYFVAEHFHPEGVSLGVFGQAGGFLSSSCCEIGGRRGAGGGGLRLGTVATDRILLSLQLEGATVPLAVEEETLIEDLQRSGFAFASSIGFDFVQLTDVWTFGLSKQDLALSYELNFVGALYPPGEVAGEAEQDLGAIVQLTMGVGLHWY
jgi:hypothetical protein